MDAIASCSPPSCKHDSASSGKIQTKQKLDKCHSPAKCEDSMIKAKNKRPSRACTTKAKNKPSRACTMEVIRKAWPPARRAAQAARCRALKPWTKSTGPKSAAGKARVAQNAIKHNRYSTAYRFELSRLRTLLREQKRQLFRYINNITSHSPCTPSTMIGNHGFIMRI